MTRFVAICGLPESGKTTFSCAMGSDHVIHTDDYMDEWSFEELPVKLIEHLTETYKDYSGTVVVEGIQVARMLRTGFRESIWSPSVVIWLTGGSTTSRVSSVTEKAFQDWQLEAQRPAYSVTSPHQYHTPLIKEV